MLDAVKAGNAARVSTADRPGWSDRLPDATPAVLAYLAVRFLGLAMLWIFADHAGADFWRLLNGRFDSNWYVGIVDDGYASAIQVGPDGEPRQTNLAFFPLFPALIFAVAAVTQLPTAAAALVVSWVSGAAAAWGIYRIGAHLRSRLAGTVLVVLWAALPHAIVQNMAYSESLFTALAAWSLYALLRGRWLLAGVLCLLAGLTRPTAIALIAAVGLAALIAVIRRRDGWRPWAAMALAPLGYLGYLAWVGHRLGQADGYYVMQREGWRMAFDGGAYTLKTVDMILTHRTALANYVAVALLGAAIVLLGLSIAGRLPMPMIVYGAVSVIVAWGTTGTLHSKGRFLMPVFTLLVPIAFLLAAAKPWVRVAVLGALVAASAWYGTYLCLDWKHSP